MIMKVKKGTVERPAMPSFSENINGSPSVNSGGGLASLSKEEMVAYLDSEATESVDPEHIFRVYRASL